MRELWTALLRGFTILASESAAAKCTDIPMAVVGPMTGDWAHDGEEMRRGAQLAVDDINGKGGVRGCKIALTVLDDQYTPATAIALAKKLAKDGVRFVIGHFNSGSSIPAATIYAKNYTLALHDALPVDRKSVV